MFGRSAGQAKWGGKSRMSKKVTQQARTSASEQRKLEDSSRVGTLARASDMPSDSRVIAVRMVIEYVDSVGYLTSRPLSSRSF
jgi:hypothetical protein